MSTFTGRTGADVHFEAIGNHVPILALHGAYSAHEEMRAVLEPILAPLDGFRRIYPDLPGMGNSPPHESMRTANDVLDLLDELIDAEIGATEFLVVGHSFGGHLARGLAARHADRVAGLALICPMMPATMNAETHAVDAGDGNPADWLEPELVDEYTSYFVLQSPATADRFREAVAPVIGRFDGETVERIMVSWALDPDPDATPFDQPTMVITGRHDSFTGFRDQKVLIDIYPRATYIAVADAGHAVPHEHPELVAALIRDWASRCGRRQPSDHAMPGTRPRRLQ